MNVYVIIFKYKTRIIIGMKSTTSRSFWLLFSFIIIIACIEFLPQLILSNTITILEGMIIVLPISISVVYINMKVRPSSAGLVIKPKIIIISTALLYFFLATIVYILSSSNFFNRLLLLVPLDIAIFGLPAYLIYRSRRPAQLNPDDFSYEYTRRLQTLIGESELGDHEVYISRKKAIRSFARTSDGTSWKVLLNNDAAEQLDKDEKDAVILEAYYSRKLGTSTKILLWVALYIAIAFDFLLGSSILISDTSPDLSLASLIISISGVVMVVLAPLFIQVISSGLQKEVDINVLRHLPSPDPFTSAIHKKISMMTPLRPLSLKQQLRYENRINRMFDKRINRIRRLSADYRKP